MGRTVLLRHELPDGSVHYDWMIQARPGVGLITFRVQERIDLPGIAGFRAERLAEHRETFLEYEGPVSSGRGRVDRLATGELEVTLDEPDLFECRGRLGEIGGHFRGRNAGATWDFGFLPAER